MLRENSMPGEELSVFSGKEPDNEQELREMLQVLAERDSGPGARALTTNDLKKEKRAADKAWREAKEQLKPGSQQKIKF